MTHFNSSAARLRFACAAILCLSIPALAQRGPPPAKVVLDQVRLETVQQRREVTGELRAAKRSILASQVDGFVLAVEIEPGEQVQRGSVIARLDDTLARLGLEQANAALSSRLATVSEREARLGKAARDMERTENSYSRGAASETNLDEARTDAAEAQSRLEQARAEVLSVQASVHLAEKRLADMTIEAPFAGRVLSKRTEVGQWLSEGEAVAEILALDQLDAWLDIPQHLGAGLNDPATASIQIRIDAVAMVLEATNVYVIPQVDALSRLFPVRVRLENKDELLRPGMSIVGLVPTNVAKPTLTIHKDAVLRDDAGQYVYFNANGTAAPARIRTLFAVGDRFAINSDSLPPDAQIVIEGNERMYPGQPLKILTGDAASQAPKDGN